MEAADLDGVALPTQGELIIVGIYLTLFILGLIANGMLLSRMYRNRAGWLRGVYRLEWRPWGLKHAGIVVGGVLLVSLIIGLLAQALIPIKDGSALENPVINLVLGGLLVQGVTLAIVFLMLHKRGLSWTTAFGNTRLTTRHQVGSSVLLYLAITPVVIVSAVLSGLLLSGLGIEVKQQEVFQFMTDSMSPGMLILSFLVAVIGAPISEELVFRGIALPVAAKHLGTVPAVMLISIIFALIHLNTASFFPLFVLAIGLAAAYLYTQSILVPILMHAMFNAVQLGLFFLYLHQEKLTTVGAISW
jgi:membrane protease YdiL (CAAX protease family)